MKKAILIAGIGFFLLIIACSSGYILYQMFFKETGTAEPAGTATATAPPTAATTAAQQTTVITGAAGQWYFTPPDGWLTVAKKPPFDFNFVSDRSWPRRGITIGGQMSPLPGQTAQKWAEDEAVALREQGGLSFVNDPVKITLGDHEWFFIEYEGQKREVNLKGRSYFTKNEQFLIKLEMMGIRDDFTQEQVNTLHGMLNTMSFSTVYAGPAARVVGRPVEAMAFPEGYTPQSCEEINGSLLCPDGWYFKKEQGEGQVAYFISKEEITSADSIFTTGLTMNVIFDIQAKTGRTPLAFARGMLEAARHEHTLSREWEDESGPFKSVGYVWDGNDGAKTIRVHNLCIANPATGTLYLITYEAPVAEWDEAWRIGEPVLANMMLDDEI